MPAQATSEVLDFEYGQLHVIVYCDSGLDYAEAKATADRILAYCEQQKEELETRVYDNESCPSYTLATSHHLTYQGHRFVLECTLNRKARGHEVAVRLEMMAHEAESLPEEPELVSDETLKELGYADFAVGETDLIV